MSSGGFVSLPWVASNAGKRSIALNLESDSDRSLLLSLVNASDMLIESFAPGYLDGIGLGCAALSRVNPRLVVVSITPFGQYGPHASWQGSDLVLWAMSGVMANYGDPDRAPLSFGIPHAYLIGSIHAVAGALIALHARNRDGVGDHVDLSVQDALSRCHMPAPPLWVYDRLRQPRAGNRVALNSKATSRVLWPCRDGQINFIAWGGILGKWSKNCVSWMQSEGKAGHLADIDWAAFDNYSASREQVSAIDQVFADFFASHTLAELIDGALKWRVALTPINSIAEIMGDPHLLARHYWQEVQQPGLSDALKFPGSPYRFSRTPVKIGGPAPTLDEHRKEIIEELAVGSRSPQSFLPMEKRPSGALGGLKVLDLSLMFAGPWTTAYLSDFGAEVVRIESSRHPDPARDHPPFKDGIADAGHSYMGLLTGNGKASMTLDLTTESGRQIAYDLVRWADVVTESYSTGAAERMGLGYEKLSRIKPDIIMLSTNLEGRTGPRADSVGFGSDVQGRAGLVDTTGWSDRGSAVPHHAYGDVITPWFGVIAILAALEHRRRTGEGQYIELSMYESLLSLVVVPVLDFSISRAIWRRQGNRSRFATPHGVYACTGEDRWCAITVTSEAQWNAFRKALGNPVWSDDPRFSDLAGRRAHEDDLDRFVSSWTKTLSPDRVAETLQASSIPAAVVQRIDDLMERDVHSRDRGIFCFLPKKGLGPVLHFVAPPKLTRTPSCPKPSAFVGEHTEWVCKNILKMSPDTYRELIQNSVLT